MRLPGFRQNAHVPFKIFWSFLRRVHMKSPVTVEDAWVLVDPHLCLGHLCCVGQDKLSLLRFVVLNFSIVVFNELLGHDWHDGRRVRNSSDLSAQVMLLLSKEEWIADDRSLQVPSEHDL